jgi:endoglucanase
MRRLSPLSLLLALAFNTLACDSAESSTAGDGDGTGKNPPGSAGTGTGGAGNAGASGGTSGTAGTSNVAPAEPLPWLHVEGNQIKDPAGNAVILRGVSLIDLSVTESWEGGITRMIDRLTKSDDPQGSSPGWYTRVLRFAVVPEDGESESPVHYQPGSSIYYDTILRPAVDYALTKGLYVIIDWHYIADTTPHRDTTNAFWADIAPRFANDSNVMFELYNEPINAGQWPSVKADMQSFYDTVRAGAPNNLVLVGTPNWCQVVAPTASDPLNGTNIVYVAHMYPQHWANPSLRQQIVTAAAVHPVFVTEWGFQENLSALLGGTITSYGAPFTQFLEENKLSSTAWCASSNWGPPMFNIDYTLRVGAGEMGGFVKDFLYEKRDSDRPALN